MWNGWFLSAIVPRLQCAFRRAQLGGDSPAGEQLAAVAAQCASLEGSLAALVQRVEKNEREPPTPVSERAVKHDVSLLVDAVQARSAAVDWLWLHALGV